MIICHDLSKKKNNEEEKEKSLQHAEIIVSCHSNGDNRPTLQNMSQCERQAGITGALGKWKTLMTAINTREIGYRDCSVR